MFRKNYLLICFAILFLILNSCSSSSVTEAQSTEVSSSGLVYGTYRNDDIGDIYVDDTKVFSDDIGILFENSKEGTIANDVKLLFEQDANNLVLRVLKDGSVLDLMFFYKISHKVLKEPYEFNPDKYYYNHPITFFPDLEQDPIINTLMELFPKNSSESYMVFFREYQAIQADVTIKNPTHKLLYHRTSFGGLKAYTANSLEYGHVRKYKVVINKKFVSVIDMKSGEKPLYAVYAPDEAAWMIKRLSPLGYNMHEEIAGIVKK